MPDVQEVFRMATQKVRPDPGALERQSRGQQRRATRQRTGSYALLAILVIAAAVISVLALRPRDQQPADQPERDAPTAAELATRPHVLDLDTGEATLLPESLANGYSYVASPDGERVAYTNRSSECDAGGMTIASLDGSDVRAIEPPEGFAYCAPRWSPDGSMLVFQRRAALGTDVGNLFLYDVATGEVTQITSLGLDDASWWFLSPIWSPEGDRIFYHLPRSAGATTTWDIWSVPATGGDPRRELRNAQFPMPNPAPPGDPFAIQFLLPLARELGGQNIMSGHPCCANRQTLVEANKSIWWPTMSPTGQRIAYQDGGTIYVLEIMTGESRAVGEGNAAEWLDSDTLIVAP
jgi:Tol biopolymer transport system component